MHANGIPQMIPGCIIVVLGIPFLVLSWMCINEPQRRSNFFSACSLDRKKLLLCLVEAEEGVASNCQIMLHALLHAVVALLHSRALQIAIRVEALLSHYYAT